MVFFKGIPRLPRFIHNTRKVNPYQDPASTVSKLSRHCSLLVVTRRPTSVSITFPYHCYGSKRAVPVSPWLKRVTKRNPTLFGAPLHQNPHFGGSPFSTHSRIPIAQASTPRPAQKNQPRASAACRVPCEPRLIWRGEGKWGTSHPAAPKDPQMAVGHPDKWNQRLKPAVPWWVYFDPCLNQGFLAIHLVGPVGRWTHFFGITYQSF